MLQYKREKYNNDLVEYGGIFRRQLTTFEAMVLILGGTIGAGMLAIPYAVAQVGLAVGIVYLVVIGILMIGLNLMVGEVCMRTKTQYQIPGLARKYIGKGTARFMTVMLYVMTLGVQVVYIIGTGRSLNALFGNSDFFWSIVFFIFAAICVCVGLGVIKRIEIILIALIFIIIALIATYAIPHISMTYIAHINLAGLLLPYGVILFGYSGAASIPEAHSLLVRNPDRFKKAIVYSGLLVMALYIFFAYISVGVMGAQTTEIATIGLGNVLGPHVLWLGNLFAVLAMGTSFLINGVALRDSLRWDFKLPTWLANVLVNVIPIILFLVGVRQFIVVLDIIGGVFVSIEMLLLVLIYWRAKQMGDIPIGKYRLHNAALIAALLIVALTAGAVYSVAKFF